MTNELISAVQQHTPQSDRSAGIEIPVVNSSPGVIQAGYNANLASALAPDVGVLANDARLFSISLEQPGSDHNRQAQRSGALSESDGSSALSDALLRPFELLDTEAASLADKAEQLSDPNSELSPGDVILLTAQSHEFMFHSQLTANIANRAVEGVQQLFRQQG